MLVHDVCTPYTQILSWANYLEQVCITCHSVVYIASQVVTAAGKQVTNVINKFCQLICFIAYMKQETYYYSKCQSKWSKFQK